MRALNSVDALETVQVTKGKRGVSSHNRRLLVFLLKVGSKAPKEQEHHLGAGGKCGTLGCTPQAGPGGFSGQ